MKTKTAIQRLIVIALAAGALNAQPPFPPPDIANGIKPPQVEDPTTAYTRMLRARQLQLENKERELHIQQQQRDLAAPRLLPATTANAEPDSARPINDFSTAGHLNGRGWGGATQLEKLMYFAGAKSALEAVPSKLGNELIPHLKPVEVCSALRFVLCRPGKSSRSCHIRFGGGDAPGRWC